MLLCIHVLPCGYADMFAVMGASACAHVCVYNMYVFMCAGMGSSSQGSMEGINTNLGLQWGWGALGWYDQPKKAVQGLRRLSQEK